MVGVRDIMTVGATAVGLVLVMANAQGDPGSDGRAVADIAWMVGEAEPAVCVSEAGCDTGDLWVQDERALALERAQSVDTFVQDVIQALD